MIVATSLMVATTERKPFNEVTLSDLPQIGHFVSIIILISSF